jgi:hypothetical protein
MIKRLLTVVLSLFVVTAHAQFTPGQILTAAQLNSQFSLYVPMAGGTLTGSLTVPTLSTANATITGGTITGLAAPVPTASGGTGLSFYSANHYVNAITACGVVAGGSVDQSAAINSCLSTYNSVSLPSGSYYTTGTINVATNQSLIGAGKGQTVISPAFASGDVIQIGNGTTNPNNVVVSGLTINGTVARTSGAAVHLMNGHFIRLADLRITGNQYNAIVFDGGAQQFGYFLENFEIDSGTYGLVLGANGTPLQDVFVSKGIVANTTTSGAIIYVASGWYFSDVDIAGNNGYGLMTYPGSGQAVLAGHLKNVLTDSLTRSGYYIATNGGTVKELSLSDPWVSTVGTASGDHGIKFSAATSGAIDGVSIENPRISNNYGDGIYVDANSVNVSILNPQVCSNSTAGSALFSGIEFAAGAQQFAVTGGISGLCGLFDSTNLQAYGVKVDAGSSNNYSIQAVLTPSNVTGGISDGGTGTAKLVLPVTGSISASALTAAGNVTTTNGNFLGGGGGYSIGTTTGLSSGGAIQLFDGTHGSNVTILNGGSTVAAFSSGSAAITGSISHSAQEIDKSYSYSTPTTGTTVALATGTETAVINPAGTLAALTVTLPACTSGYDGSIARYSSSQTITTLTLTATSGSVSNAPTSLAAGSGHAMVCRGTNTTWFPLY